MRRFWHSTTDEHGQLSHHRGNKWVFAWPGEGVNEEPIFRFDSHTFADGEYVSVTEHDGVARPFRIVSVNPVDARGH